MSLETIAQLARYSAAPEKQGGYWSELLGGVPIAGALAGGGLGALGGSVIGELADTDRMFGPGNTTAAGGLGGALLGAYLHALANTGGFVGGAVTPTRDAEAQREADKSMFKNFIPGVAGYNASKRLGYSIRNPELKRKEDKDKEDSEKESAYKFATAPAFKAVHELVAQQAKQAGELKCPTCGKSDCNCPEYKALKKQKGY